jgi:DNA-binding response OmpR family regulator
MHVQQSSKRTVAGAPPKGAEAAGMVRGDYCFLERRRVVLHREREVLLQPREFEFALQLFQNVGRVLTREWLRESIWRARHHREDSRVLDVCAANLRRKLALQSENGFVLKAVYKTGYCLFEMPLDSAPAEKKARGHQWLLPSNEPETAA